MIAVASGVITCDYPLRNGFALHVPVVRSQNYCQLRWRYFNDLISTFINEWRSQNPLCDRRIELVCSRSRDASLAQTKNSELVALVSDNPTKLEELSQKYGVQHTYSYEEYEKCLTSGEVDAVHIALSNHRHCLVNRYSSINNHASVQS
jgi:hypothetical protein